MHQIVYTEIPQQQIYIQNPNVIQYNLDANLQDYHTLEGVQYNIANFPAQITNNPPFSTNINYSPNQICQQNVQQPITQQYIYQHQIKENVQQVYPQNIDNSKQYQNKIQMQVQPQNVQQNNYNNDQKVQISPQQQVYNGQAQQNYQIQLKHQAQTQHHQKGQSRGNLSPENNYMKYLKKFPNQNTNQKINIEYNKKDEHFVNRPIYKERKLPPNPDKNKTPTKKLKTLDDTPTLLQGTKMIKLNTKSNNNKQKNQLVKNPQKGISELPQIKEEDAKASQRGSVNK